MGRADGARRTAALPPPRAAGRREGRIPPLFAGALHGVAGRTPRRGPSVPHPPLLAAVPSRSLHSAPCPACVISRQSLCNLSRSIPAGQQNTSHLPACAFGRRSACGACCKNPDTHRSVSLSRPNATRARRWARTVTLPQREPPTRGAETLTPISTIAPRWLTSASTPAAPPGTPAAPPAAASCPHEELLLRPWQACTLTKMQLLCKDDEHRS